jgi:hypothetical protein
MANGGDGMRRFVVERADRGPQCDDRQFSHLGGGSSQLAVLSPTVALGGCTDGALWRGWASSPVS